MQVICLEEEAFYALIEQFVNRLKEKSGTTHDKSRTTLQKLRDQGKIRFFQPQKKIILYDRLSINAYLEKLYHSFATQRYAY